MNEILDKLKQEPALAWKLAVNVQGRPDASAEAHLARRQVWDSPLVRQLLAVCNRRQGAYKKWDGPHWVLSLLADLGCPAGDDSLRPLMEETFEAWLSPAHALRSVFMIEGRERRHASQEGNAAWSSMRLGFTDHRTDALVEILLKAQWPDGGWNCDRHPEADTSSFMESLIPLRALALYARVTGDSTVRAAASRAAEVFLSRRLFRRAHTGNIIRPTFVKLHYPAYWHYDILFGLKVLAEAGFIGDPRCREALDLLESKRLPDGGFPAEETFTRPSRPQLTGYSPISWGGVSAKNSNLFVTADALYVLRLSARL
jgi:hypothetical protein